MLQWENVSGHWHWYPEERSDGTWRWEISLNVPQAGRYAWACQCPAKPTHNVGEVNYRTVPTDPIIIHRKEW